MKWKESIDSSILPYTIVCDCMVKSTYEPQISSVLDIQLNSWLYGFASVKNIYAYG